MIEKENSYTYEVRIISTLQKTRIIGYVVFTAVIRRTYLAIRKALHM